jgi:hypothetical protein
MSVIKANTHASSAGHVSIFSVSETYIEMLTIKQIEAQRWLTELIIKTQLLTANNPEEKRVKARCGFERVKLMGLVQTIDMYLKAPESH